MSKKAKVIFFLLFLILFVGFIFSAMTLAFVNLPSEHHYMFVYYEGDIPKNLTLIVPIPYIDGKPAIKTRFPSKLNVTTTETPYGKMLKIESEEIDFSIGSFISSDKTIDIINANITLSPVVEREPVSKTESDKGISEKYRIKVPVYAEFEGNSTILVRFEVRSGFKALPFFFIYTIPLEPRYGWKAYLGHKTIEFKISSKGWQIVEGSEELRIIYQRMW